MAWDIFKSKPTVSFLYSSNIIDPKGSGNLLKYLSTTPTLYPCLAVVALYK
jgi:hypothetical protein